MVVVDMGPARTGSAACERDQVPERSRSCQRRLPSAARRDVRRRPRAGATPQRRRSTSGPLRWTARASSSEEVLKSLEAGQRAAIEAVRKFVATVDKTLPPRGDAQAKRQDVIDSAMELADRLVHVQ